MEKERIGLGTVVQLHPDYNSYPDMDFVDYCVVEVTRVEPGFNGHVLPYIQESVEVGECLPWPLNRLVDVKDYDTHYLPVGML